MLSTSERAPYVVLLGDVGTGKSTLVEKLTGIKGRSSFSFRWVVDGRLCITKVSHKTVKSERSSKPQFGCGKSINWKEMATVALPPELS